jgi:Ca2+-binding RTX toxin-like protein
MSRAMNSTLPDQFNGYAGNDSIDGNAGDDTLIGGTGNDTLIGALGTDKLLGGAGNDTYVVDDSDDIIDETGGTGIDTVVVRNSEFSLYDNGRGAVENARIEALGLSIVSGNDIGNEITGNAEQNQVYGFVGNDTIDGGDGNDTLDGGFGADKLTGGDGTDSLFGAFGSDTLLGGLGNDFYGIDDGDSVVESQGGTLGGVDTVRYNGAAGSFTLGANIENLVLGSGKNGTGNDLGNSITGNTAENRLFGLAGNDTLQSEGENDTLDGGKGADLMQGGNDADTYIVDSIFDIVDETGAKAGKDTVESSVSYSLRATDGQVIGDVENLILKGSAAIDGTGNGVANLLTGNSGTNKLLGLEGNDTLDGGAGADTMEGGSGNDTYVLDSTADVFIETGSDSLDMVVVNKSVDLNTPRFQGIESVTLTGTAALNAIGTNSGNQLFGNAGANKLSGFGSLDELRGGDGSDTLDGGEGDDILIGGAGNDTYIFAYESALDGHDLIVGFDGNPAGDQDFLDIDALFDSLGVATAGRAARVQASDRGAAVDIRVDTDGNGTFDLFAATLQTPDAVTIGVDVILGNF